MKIKSAEDITSSADREQFPLSAWTQMWEQDEKRITRIRYILINSNERANYDSFKNIEDYCEEETVRLS